MFKIEIYWGKRKDKVYLYEKEAMFNAWWKKHLKSCRCYTGNDIKINSYKFEGTSWNLLQAETIA